MFHVSLVKPGLIFRSSSRINSRNSSRSVGDNAEKYKFRYVARIFRQRRGRYVCDSKYEKCHFCRALNQVVNLRKHSIFYLTEGIFPTQAERRSASSD